MERRKHIRVQLHHPVIFVGLDEKGRRTKEDVAMALNIHQEGILLESENPIKSPFVVITATVGGGQQLTITGSVIYTNRLETDKYRTGIFYKDSPEVSIQFAEKVVQAYLET
jgi:hypothetical protein